MNKAIFLFPLILISLLTAIWTGWLRIGWSLPIPAPAARHGALMVNSFLASLIFLERAVTFRQKWILLLPLVQSLSVLAFLAGLTGFAHVIIVAGSIGFVIMCCYFIIRYRELYYYVFLLGAICLAIGNFILLRTNDYPRCVNWWIGFLLFTIVAERLELSKFLQLTSLKKSLLLICLICFGASLVLSVAHWGMIVLPISLAATGIWLLKYDMARISVRATGQHRYSGILLLVGFIWLILMAGLMFVQGKIPFGYDAVLHSFFIGFVFSMIFSHAPIILPAISRLPIKLYRPLLYVWFALLQASLVARIIADTGGWIVLRKAAGLINGLTILLFFFSVAGIVLQELAIVRSRKA